MKKLVVRLAEPSEAEVLTRLAMTAKASWGYSDRLHGGVSGWQT
jgi:hypothetical protein